MKDHGLAEHDIRTSTKKTASPQWVSFLLLAAAQFMVVLDGSIVAIALPSIQEEVSFDSIDASWVYNSYVLTLGGCLLLCGRLSDVIGGRRALCGGLVLFSIASFLAGVASSAEFLVAARAVQGLSGAIVVPAIFSMLVTVYPDGDTAEKIRRNKAYGAIGAASAIGGTAGFFLGGALTYIWGWASVFLVNVPVGLFLALFIRRWLPGKNKESRPGVLPVTDAAIFTITATLLVYLTLNLRPGQLRSIRTLWILVVVASLMTILVMRHRRGAGKLISPALLRNSAIPAANIICLLTNMASGPVILLVSLYVQDVLAFSPLSAGLSVIPVTLAIAISSVGGNMFIRRLGLRRTSVFGIVVWIFGVLWLTGISDGSYIDQVLLPEIVIGLGSGLVFLAFAVAGTVGAGVGDTGTAGGLLGTTQQIGAALGVALVTSVVTERTVGATGNGDQVMTSGYKLAMIVVVIPLLAAGIASLRLPAGQGDAQARVT
jgi:MFS family permease